MNDQIPPSSTDPNSEENGGFFRLYRYCSWDEAAILFISTISSVAAGTAIPLMSVIFGQVTTSLKDYVLHKDSRSEFEDNISTSALFFVYIGIGEFITVSVATTGFVYVGAKVAQRIREQYLKAILRQDMAFFDNLGTGEITRTIATETHLVQAGISESVSTALTSISTFVSALIVSLIISWKLALISSAAVIAMGLLMGGASVLVTKRTKKSLEALSLGATIAEEAVSSIRVAIAFGAQDSFVRKYATHLEESGKWGQRAKAILGFSFGGMMCITMLNIGLGFWEGSRLLVVGEITIGNIVAVVLSLVIGGFSLGYLAPNVQTITTGIAASRKILNVINRESSIDAFSSEGKTLATVEGDITFHNIRHCYPSRPDIEVLKEFTLSIPAGKTVALVGSSGSGKSTCVSLIERFYEATEGRVCLDGHDIRSLNLKWLRQQIGLVNQEPTLFRTSIYDNIKYGLVGSKNDSSDKLVVERLIIDAAKVANAHDFIISLPDGYKTQIGDDSLSGGQKQRIAIARAIVGNPSILLLDEATSALDAHSEGSVQAALEVAAKGRTTIIIAHRLSTIRHADNIIVMSHGKIVEQGTHDWLLEQKGHYSNLVIAQRLQEGSENNSIRFSQGIPPGKGTSALKPSHSIEKSNKGSQETINTLNHDRNEPSSLHEKSEKIAVGGRYPPKASVWALIKFIASFNKTDSRWMVLGLTASILAGCNTPTHVVFLSKCVQALSLPPWKRDELRSDVNFWALMYLMLGFVALITYSVSSYAFAICSERLLLRARKRAFQSMLRQDPSFFDREENNPGALMSFLSTQTTNLAGISGSVLGMLLTVFTTLIASITIAIAFGWKLGLVCTAMVPILVSCGYLRFYLLAQLGLNSKFAYENSAGFACEAVDAIRTVASLNREDKVLGDYHSQLFIQSRKSLTPAIWTSTVYGICQSLFFFCTGLAFWYGGKLIARREYTLFQLFVCFIEILFSTLAASTIFANAPDMSLAKVAAQSLLSLVNEVPQIDTSEGASVDILKGEIEFRDVSFSYPTRPSQWVLEGINFKVSPGSQIAIVGVSGSGKSTIISLIERFYQPALGGIFVDGYDISNLRVQKYRQFLALVNQEPTLFQGSIRENILLGATASQEKHVKEDDIIKVCKEANIYEFIISLPDGLNTMVGSKGILLSGGQKQRISIARALLRDPKILLLDEATSALDSESETIVQQALELASRGRTTVTIAHRLSTIQRADKILVFDEGRIVETGTHDDLLQLKGRYYGLAILQGAH